VSTRVGSPAERAADRSVQSAPQRRRSDRERPAPPFDLLESKLLPPQGPAGVVSRDALIERLEGAARFPVVFLSAGPGWGKTTLLGGWAARSPRSFAWVHVDEKDNDPIVLLTYVATALDRVSPIDASVFEALTSPGASVEGTVVPRLSAALAAIPQPLVLVLDDLHLLHDRASLDAVATLARHVRGGKQLALSARGAPALPLGALRAQGLELELGPEDLRMDVEQAGELLQAAGVDLPDGEVAALTAHTEGWSAGLYLAALSIRARGSNGGPAVSFSGSNLLVSDYLQSALLAQLSADEVRFLTRSSVLDRLSGPLCDAVLERSGSASTLGSLARANLFLVPLDPNGEWYRYHHLFKELLRSELVRAEPELVPDLLARGADWCETYGHPERAIGYAQQAGDVDRVARLVERCTQPAHQGGRVTTVEGWLGWLDAQAAIERNAAVAVLGALVAAVRGRPVEAERWADAANRASYSGTLYDGSQSIESWRSLLSAMLCRGGPTRMRADAELAVRTLAPASHFWPVALLLVAMSRLLVGELDAADDLLADVVEASGELEVHEPLAVALSERAAIAIERGAWVRAEELSDRALLVIHRARLEEYPTSGFVCAVAARVALHRRDAVGAHALLGRTQRVRPGLTYALPHVAVQTRLELARAYLAMADAGGAETMLRELAELLRRRPDLGALPAQAEELRSRLQTMHVQAPGASTLTEAELRVLPYLATHLSFREISERLFLSRHTIKSHAMAIYRKLSVTSRTDAVDRAGALGLL
jgi:LuxR family transcriptional regulator, maltose regulon positive regulatory protein